MEQNNSFSKRDLIAALIIGEVCAWLLIPLIKNLQPAMYEKYWQLILVSLPVIFPALCVLGLFVAFILGKKIKIIYQIAKFILVGGFNTLFDWGLLALIIWIFRSNFSIESTDTFFVVSSLSIAYYSLFKAISFSLATTNSFFWNKFWTFKRESAEKAGKEFLQFLTVSIVGFLANVGIASAIFKLVPARAGLNSDQWGIVAAVVATAIAMVWNFLGYKFIVFENKKSKPESWSSEQTSTPPPPTQKKIV